MVEGTTNNSSPMRLPGADSTFPPFSFSIDPESIDQVDNEPPVSGPSTQVANEGEPRERQKKEDEGIELEKPEVRCNLHPFRWYVFLIPSQREKKRNELGHEKQEEEARERKEHLEVCCDAHLLQRDVTPTPPQRQKTQRELERDKEEGVKEHKEELGVCWDPASSDRILF